MAEAACDRMRRSDLVGKQGARRAPSRYSGDMTPSFSVMTASRSGCRRPFSARRSVRSSPDGLTVEEGAIESRAAGLPVAIPWCFPVRRIRLPVRPI
jgi:hypothetical protein